MATHEDIREPRAIRHSALVLVFGRISPWDKFRPVLPLWDHGLYFQERAGSPRKSSSSTPQASSRGVARSALRDFPHIDAAPSPPRLRDLPVVQPPAGAHARGAVGCPT